MRKNLSFFNFTPFLLIFLTLIGLFLRFYKLTEWFFFMIDEDLTSFLIKRMLFERKPLLVGFSFPGDIYPGPLFYYLGALIMVLFKMSPGGWAYFASLVSSTGIPFIYYVGKKIFKSATLGVFAAILYTFSYLINIHNRTFNPLITGPILTLLVYFSLYKIIEKKQLNWVYPLILALTLAAQTEGSNLSLIFLTIFMWLAYKLPIRHPKVLKAMGIFFLSHITVLIFDLRHHFVVSRALIKFFSFKHSSGFNLKTSLQAIPLLPRTLARILFISGPTDLTKQILPCKKYLILIDKQLDKQLPLLIFAWFLVIFFLASFFLKKKRSFGLKIVTANIFVNLFGLVVYGLLLPGYAHEWFFVVFFSGLCLVAAYLFAFLWRGGLLNKILVLVFLLIFIISNLKTTLRATSSYGFKNKNEAVLYAVEQVRGQDFYLQSLGSCFRWGYRYLFWLNKHEPVISFMDYLLAGWLYPKIEVKEKPKIGVVIVNWEDKETEGFMEKYKQYLQKTRERKTFEQIEILIVNESENLI